MSRLPEAVPALTADDMTHLMDEGTRHCCIGWKAFAFGPTHDIHLHCGVLMRAAKELGIVYHEVVSFTGRATHDEMAQVWNRAMELYGYVRDGDVYRLAAAALQPGGQQ